MIAKASDGCQIRILIANPVDCLRPLLRQARIEIRALEDIEPLTIHRADQQMLAALRLTELLDAPPFLLHLEHHRPGGLFDRLTEHYQTLWDTATEPIQTDHDIDKYLFEDEAEQSSPLSDTPQPPASPMLRRWPRRPAP